MSNWSSINGIIHFSYGYGWRDDLAEPIMKYIVDKAVFTGSEGNAKVNISNKTFGNRYYIHEIMTKEYDKNIPYEYEEWCKSWSNELLRITKPASPILIFSSRRLQHRVSNALEDSGFVIRDVLIWEKNRCNAKAQRINNVLNKRNIIDSKYNNYRIGNLAPYYEPIIFAMKPYKGTITDCVLENNVGGFYCENDKIPSNIFKIDVNKRNKYHETEKPIELMEKLISVFSMENQVILDFTMGGGSTGVAAMNLHRKFIGIELDPQYFEIAQKRIQDIVL
jgi:site-specific DNA-methyltransferase (adenine-specific)